VYNGISAGAISGAAVLAARSEVAGNVDRGSRLRFRLRLIII
jgi:hypothetical protein